MAEYTIEDRVAALEAAIGWHFSDRSHAIRALTHRSWMGDHPDEDSRHYERLEFLGDAVVDLAVAYVLMTHFPDASEGALTKRRAALVNQTHLAEAARRLGLGRLIRMGRGEAMSGGRDKASILSDAVEAVVGAVFMDGGFEAALDVVRRIIPDLELPFENDSDRLQDHKSELQELTQRVYKKRPVYERLDDDGGRGGHFVYQVRVAGRIISDGRGSTKKQAQQEAARHALRILRERLKEGGHSVTPDQNPEEN